MENNHVSVWGRTLEEYQKMFGLGDIPTSTQILSIADGPSTFNKQLRDKEINIVSVDPIYELSIDNLKEVFKQSYQFNKGLFYNNRENFLFKDDTEIEALLQKRQSTFNAFITDYGLNKQYYKFGQLPTLDFATNSFDLCVSSNLLFIFDHIFDLTFHIQSVKEMLRVAKELRIFPLYDINGNESKNLKSVIEYLDQNNYQWTIQTNDYYVYKDGNKFLQVFGSAD
ncbi:MAG: hypothetical protein ABIX01_09995 [Chitinophagaceae bacterium]